MTLEGRWPRVACPPTTPAFCKLLREHSPAWTTIQQVILHFGFCYRIKTPRWLEWPWNLSTDYSGFTWSESNVKATLRLRGTGRCALRRVCYWSRPWNRTRSHCTGGSPSLLPTLSQWKHAQSWWFLQDLSPRSFTTAFAAFAKALASARTDRVCGWAAFGMLRKEAAVCHFPTALDFFFLKKKKNVFIE